MWAHPGKKLLFMGGELATPWEWAHEDELPWWLLEHTEHAGMRDLVRDLNTVYRDEPALWEVDFSHEGFVWIEPNDAMNNVLAFVRVSTDGKRQVVCIANLAPVPRENYRVGLPAGGAWQRAPEHGLDVLRRHRRRQPRRGEAEERAWHDQPFSAEVTLPPLAVLWLRPAGEPDRAGPSCRRLEEARDRARRAGDDDHAPRSRGGRRRSCRRPSAGS